MGRAAVLAAFSILMSGCGTVAKKTASGVEKLATRAVKETGKATRRLTVATAKAGGKIVLSAGKASGKALLELAKSGEVTFVNAATGLVSSIPFVEKLNLKQALAAAKFDPKHKLFDVVRPTGIMRIGWTELSKLGGAKLNSGDVIRVVQLVAN